MRIRLLGVALLFAFCVNAWATPITLTYTGTGSGTVGGSSFTNAAFTITALGDTANVHLSSGIHFLNHSSASIEIAGLGTLNFLTATRTFVNSNADTLGFTRSAGYDLYNSSSDPVFDTWDLLSSLAPIASTFTLMQWSAPPDIFLPVVTDGGTLVFNRQSVAGTFQAVVGSVSVPEPSSLVLFILGFLVVAGMSRRINVVRASSANALV